MPSSSVYEKKSDQKCARLELPPLIARPRLGEGGNFQGFRPTRSNWLCRIAAGLLILGTASFHLVYLSHDCPLDLAPDEAHYWDWSRHLDWSYYSKGPVAAYLIRASTVLVGDWARSLSGTEMPAVRLPAVACGALLASALYVLTLQVYRREPMALAVTAIALTLPLLAAGSTLMTIDAPYTCCWAWSLVLGHRAIFRGSGWAWAALGMVVGLGILAKYTMILWVPSLFLCMLLTPCLRQLLGRPGFWIMVAIAAMCCTPIVLWNIGHDWVSLRHVSGQAGIGRTMGGVLWLGPLAFVSVQFFVLLGFWFIAWVIALVVHRPWKESNPSLCYLWWMSVPMFGVFLLFSFKTPGEPNWPVTAYLSGLVLAVGHIGNGLASIPGGKGLFRPAYPGNYAGAAQRWYGRLTAASVVGACALGLAVTAIMHHSELVQPALVRLTGESTVERPLPLRRIDPTCRLRGWQTLAAAIDGLRSDLQRQAIEPELTGADWTLPGEIGFYCQGHPTVYCLGMALGDRHSQYELWHPNPLAEAESFLGRTFIYVGEISPAVRAAFDKIGPSRIVTHTENNQPISRWRVTICHGYKGFPKDATQVARY